MGEAPRGNIVVKSKSADSANTVIKSWGIANPHDPKYKLLRKIRWLKFNKISSINTLTGECGVVRGYIVNFTTKSAKKSNHVGEFIERIEPVVNWHILRNVDKVYNLENAMIKARTNGESDPYYPFINIVDLYEEMFVMGCVVRPPRAQTVAYITLPGNPVVLVRPPPYQRLNLNKIRIEEIKANVVLPELFYRENVQNLNNPINYANTYAGEFIINSINDSEIAAQNIHDAIKDAFMAFPLRTDISIRLNIQYVTADELAIPIDPTVSDASTINNEAMIAHVDNVEPGDAATTDASYAHEAPEIHESVAYNAPYIPDLGILSYPMHLPTGYQIMPTGYQIVPNYPMMTPEMMNMHMMTYYMSQIPQIQPIIKMEQTEVINIDSPINIAPSNNVDNNHDVNNAVNNNDSTIDTDVSFVFDDTFDPYFGMSLQGE
ncbi:hypothetical protein F-E9_289 [Faustovirus]|nr:hypothetical protein F-E9_289 [Faustovirus]